jgi:abequosyltransferase
MKLTIAIPSYDRYEALEHTLNIIIPQLVDGVELVVIDNASPRPVEGLVLDIARRYGVEACVRTIRNQYNIGGNANITRCFELATGVWMWLLGDDDDPASNAVTSILKQIGEDSTCAYINFSSDIKHHTCSEILDLNNLAEDLLFPTYSFMSTGVYKLAAVRPGLIYAYDMAYGSAPHLVLMLYAAYFANMKICLSPTHIVSSRGSTGAKAYSYQRVKLRFATLVEIPFLTSPGRQRLSDGILTATFPSMKTIIVDALNIGIAPSGTAKRQARYHYVEYFARARSLRQIPLTLRAIARVMNLISYNRTLSRSMCSAIERIKKKKIFTITDVCNRI